MNKYIKNLHCAPKSTMLAFLIFAIFTWLLVTKLIEKEVYTTITPIIIGFAFTDIMGENGKKETKKLTDKAKPKEDEDVSSDKE